MEEQWGGAGSGGAFDGSAGGSPGGSPGGAADGLLEAMGHLDLRRRRQRVFAERLAGLASFLPRSDELLLRAVLEEGRRVTEVAAAAEVCPRALRRRVRRLLRRIGTPRFAFVAGRMSEWTATRRMVAEACYLNGLSMREAGERHGLTRHQIRFHRDAIEALFQVEVGGPQPGAGERAGERAQREGASGRSARAPARSTSLNHAHSHARTNARTNARSHARSKTQEAA